MLEHAMHSRILALTLTAAAFLTGPSLALAQQTIIRATTLIDGKGHVLRNQEIAVENGRIVRVGPVKSKPTNRSQRSDRDAGLDRHACSRDLVFQ